MLQAVLARYPVKVITPSFLIHAQIEPVGSLLDFLNDTNRATVPLFDATLYDLNGRFKPVTRPMVIFPKPDIYGLCVEDAKARENIRLLKRVEKMIMHVPHLICRGQVHLGTETRPADILDMLVGQFIALTEASLFPLVQLPAEFPHQAEMILTHKDAVRVYYLE